MTIIDSLKQLVGYSGNDIDNIFAILSMIIVLYFVFTLFNILMSIFPRRR